MKFPTLRARLDFLTGLALLIGLDAVGRWIVHALSLPVPGSVVGMLILLALLRSSLLPLDRVRSAAALLNRHLGLFYVPAGVGIIGYSGVVRESALAIIAAALASLVGVLLVVGLIVQRHSGDG